MNIVIASTNPVKVNATKHAFEAVFPGKECVFQSISVPSGVRHQPMGSEETYNGANNRAHNAKNTIPTASYWVGIEGGVEETLGDMQAFAWVVILSGSGKQSRAKTSTFLLPERVVELIKQGKEMGDADDIVFNRTNTKQTMGAIGILTDGVIDRTTYYTDAIVLALIVFNHPEYYET